MCMLCVEVQKQRMTNREVASAFREMIVSDDHLDTVISTIRQNYDQDEVVGELAQLEITEHYQKTKGVNS